MNTISLFAILFFGLVYFQSPAQKVQQKSKGQPVAIIMSNDAHARVKYGALRLSKALSDLGYAVRIQPASTIKLYKNFILLGQPADRMVKEFQVLNRDQADVNPERKFSNSIRAK